MNDVEELERIITPLLEGLGLLLVECSIGRHRGDAKVNLVLYKPGGIGLDELTEAQKVIRPRLELDFDRDSLSVEISSPGLGRTIKTDREYEIFTGRTLRLLIGDDWTMGTLVEYDGQTLVLDTHEGTRSVAAKTIRKAKLD